MITRGVMYTIMERLIYKDDYVAVKVLFDKSVERMLTFRHRSITDIGGYILLETSHTIPDSPATYVQNDIINTYYFRDYTEFRRYFRWYKIRIPDRYIDYRLWCKDMTRMLVSPDLNTYCVAGNGLVLHIEFSSSRNSGIVHNLPQHTLTYTSSHISNLGDLI